MAPGRPPTPPAPSRPPSAEKIARIISQNNQEKKFKIKKKKRNPTRNPKAKLSEPTTSRGIDPPTNPSEDVHLDGLSFDLGGAGEATPPPPPRPPPRFPSPLPDAPTRANFNLDFFFCRLVSHSARLLVQVFCRPPTPHPRPPARCVPGQPLTVTVSSVYR